MAVEDGWKNLIPLNKKSKAEQRVIMSNGGKKSQEVQRAKRTAKAILNEFLEMPNSEYPNMTNKEVMEMRLIHAGTNPEASLKAIDMIHEMIEEKPAQKIEQKAATTFKYVTTEQTEEAFKHIKDFIK